MINYPFPPNASASALRSERLACHLREYGWSVEVVTIKPRKDIYHDHERLNKLGNHVSVHQTPTLDPWLWLKEKQVKFILFRFIRYIGMKIFAFPDHMLGWSIFAVPRAFRIVRAKNANAIYSTSPPHSTHLIAWLVCRLTGKPWIADFRDPWTLNAYRASGVIAQLLNSIEKRMERSVYEHASQICANTRANRRNLMKAFPQLEAEKVVYLPNGWEEIGGSEFPDRDNGKLKIVHSGVFYPRFNPYALFYALSAWKRSSNREDEACLQGIAVTILGVRDVTTRKLIEELEIEDLVEILPWVSLKEARHYMQGADFLWTSLGTGREASTYVPSKIYEYISARRPILGFFPKGEASEIIKNSGAGVVFHSDEPQPIIRFLKEACRSKKRGVQGFYRPNQKVINKLKIEHVVEQFSRLLNQFVKEEKAEQY
jgi:glycosyltransferase involved in cell wall biosynthesis